MYKGTVYFQKVEQGMVHEVNTVLSIIVSDN